MKHIDLALSAPAFLLIAVIAYALILGANGWMVVYVAAIAIPLATYVVFSIFTVLWALKIGEIGLKQEMTLQAKFYFYHGIAVVMVIVLSAAGSFIALFALAMKGLFGHGISG